MNRNLNININISFLYLLLHLGHAKAQEPAFFKEYPEAHCMQLDPMQD